jgi:hypothetical protein
LLLPQRMTFPFSLLTPPRKTGPDVPPGCMELLPGWLLAENPFALSRAQAKYRKRYRARRYRPDLEVFRPDTVDLMRNALRRLDVRLKKKAYTSSCIDGVGKNFVSEEARKTALEAYRFYVQYYALLGLKDWLHSLLGVAQGGDPLDLAASDPPAASRRWLHQRSVLVDDFRMKDVAGALGRLLAMLTVVASSVERAKEKDDTRGARIIDGYPDAHTPAAQDECVRQTWEETCRLRAELEELLDRWKAWDAPCDIDRLALLGEDGVWHEPPRLDPAKAVRTSSNGAAALPLDSRVDPSREPLPSLRPTRP